MKRLHRPIAFLISLLLLLGTFPFAASAVPPDMPSEEHWAYAALRAAVENGLLFGDKDGNLNPTNNLTRAEMAAVVNRAFAAVNEADISAYNDVPQGAWFYKDVAKAVAMGTFSGDGSGKMHPTNTISRQEVFAVMARAFKLWGNDLSVLDAYSDSASISGWAKSALANMVKAGYIKGSGNKLNPQGQITRQEFAQVMYSMIKTYATSETASAVGNVLVRTPETVLKDLVIEGDLIIAEGVADGVLTLENVTVTGRIVIRSGATLRLNQHSDAEGDILIYAEDATVEADKNSTFDTVIVHSNGADIHASSGDVIVAVDVADTTVNGEPAEGGVTVEIGQDDPLLLALNAANGASYTTDLPLADEEAAVAAVKVIAEAAIDNSDILVSVQVVSYTAAVDGTLAAPDGTDGALVFTLSMNDGGSPATSEEKTLVLPAVPYTAHPSVAVTPAESDIAYKGDITLTAVATDILSPTYQWYRADDADAPGSAIEGETATTLALTDLTKTAYYYCMCGTVKSNAVKVTVAENPLAEALSMVNSVTFPAASQARVPSQSAAVEFAEGLLQFVISDSEIVSTVNFISYTAPIAGTLADPDGTNGSLVFTYDLTKNGYTETTVEKTLTIIATPYVSGASLTVTPAESDIAYKGDVTLTAVAANIPSPTYQWYRADDADAPGSAIDGENANTLALTEQTETAYYYCMSGTTKSNVVKVTVDAPALQVDGVIYTDLATALDAAGTQHPVMVTGNYTIQEGTTVTVAENQMIIIDPNADLCNKGTIENKNEIEVSAGGIFTNNGTVNGLWHDDEYSDNLADGWYDSTVTVRGGIVKNSGRINDRLALRDLITGTPGGVGAPQRASYTGSGTVAQSRREAEVDSENALCFADQERCYSLAILAPKNEEDTITLSQSLTVSNFDLIVRGTVVLENDAMLTIDSDHEFTLMDAAFTVEGILQIDLGATMRLQQSTMYIYSPGGVYNEGFIEITNSAKINNSNTFENNGNIYGEAILDDTSTDAPIIGYPPTGEGEQEINGFVTTSDAFHAVASNQLYTALWVAPFPGDGDLLTSTDEDRTLTIEPQYERQTVWVSPRLIVGVLAQNGEGQRYSNILEICDGLMLYLQGGMIVSGKLINNGYLELQDDSEIEAKHSDIHTMGTLVNNNCMTLDKDVNLDCRGDINNLGAFTNRGTIFTYISNGESYPQYGSITGNPVTGNYTATTVVYNQEDFEAALSNPAVSDIILSEQSESYQFPTEDEFTRDISISAAPNSNILLDMTRLNLSGNMNLSFLNNVLFEDTADISGELNLTKCIATNSASFTIATAGCLSLGAECEFHNLGIISNNGHMNLDGTHSYCRFINDMGACFDNYGSIYSKNAELSFFNWEYDFFQSGTSTFSSIRDLNRTDLARELVYVLGERLDVLEEPTEADFEAYAQTYSDWKLFWNNPDDVWDDDIDGEYAIALLLKNHLYTPQSSSMVRPYDHIYRYEVAEFLDILAQRLGVETLLLDEDYQDYELTDTPSCSALELVRAGVMLPVEEGIFEPNSFLQSIDDGMTNSLQEMLQRYCEAMGMGSTAEVTTLSELIEALNRSFVEDIYIRNHIDLEGMSGEPLVIRSIGDRFRRVHVTPGFSLNISDGETMCLEQNVELVLECDAGLNGELFINGTLENFGGGVLVDSGDWNQQVHWGLNGRMIDFVNMLAFAIDLLPYIETRLQAPDASELNDCRMGNEWPSWNEDDVALAYLVKYANFTQEEDAYGGFFWNWNELLTYSDALSYYTMLYRAIYQDETLTLPDSVSLEDVQPESFVSYDMLWALNDSFFAVLPLIEDNTTTAITISADSPSYNGIRFLQPVTISCENMGFGDWGSDCFFSGCEFTGGLTIIETANLSFAVDLANNCTGTITVVPFEGQDLRSFDRVVLRGANGCIINATAPVEIEQYEDAVYTLNGVEFTSQITVKNDGGGTKVRLFWECNGIHDEYFWDGPQDHSGCLQEDNETPAEGIMKLESECFIDSDNILVSGVLPCNYSVLNHTDISALHTNGYDVILTDMNGTCNVNIGENDVCIFESMGNGYNLTGSGNVYLYNSNVPVTLGDNTLTEPHIFGDNENFGIYIPSSNTELQFEIEQGVWEGENVPVTEWNMLDFVYDTAYVETENKIHLTKSGDNPWICDPYQVRLRIMTPDYPTIVYDRVNHKPECFVDAPSTTVSGNQIHVTCDIEAYSMEYEEPLYVYVRLYTGTEWLTLGNKSLADFQQEGATFRPTAGTYTRIQVYLAYATHPDTYLAENCTEKNMIIP